jgi:zinc/manganese transport system substrate-binding protein
VLSRRVLAGAVLAGLASLSLTACSGTGSGDQPATSSGDAARCAGGLLTVTVSVSQWGDLVRQLGGDCTTVTTVLNSAAADPHDHELSAGDLAAFEKADLVVVNGADYDPWAAQAVAGLDPKPPIVSAAKVAGLPDGGVDPHLWYDPQIVSETAAAISAELKKLSPDAAAVFDQRAGAWQAGLRPYLDELTALRAVTAGRTYAATETVFDRTARAIGLRDVTPEGYRSAVSNESDPAPGDLAAFQAALRDGSADVLIYNTQTQGSLTNQLRAAADDAGVPVVEVTESPPDPGGSFVAWQLAQLERLSEALGGTP